MLHSQAHSRIQKHQPKIRAIKIKIAETKAIDEC